MTEKGVQKLGIEFVLKFICAGEPCGDSIRQYAKSKAFKRSMERDERKKKTEAGGLHACNPRLPLGTCCYGFAVVYIGILGGKPTTKESTSTTTDSATKATTDRSSKGRSRSRETERPHLIRRKMCTTTSGGSIGIIASV